VSLDPDFGVSLSPGEFQERLLTLHKQLFASTEFSFDDVTTHMLSPPPGLSLWDHSIIHDGQDFHLYHGMGDNRLQPEWSRRFRAGDWEGAGALGFATCIGRAVGPTLLDLKRVASLDLPSQGQFDVALRDHGALFRYKGRYGLLYDVRGGRDGKVFLGMSLSWSDDLEHWEQGDRNPVLTAPSWGDPAGMCKDPHVLEVDGVYLIYTQVMDRDGYCAVALTTTTDWMSFGDEGCVLRSAPMLRGTLGIESACVVRRDGMWHLFFTYGPGMWQAVSPSPRRFTWSREQLWHYGGGFYYMGPFHATEVVHHDGQWWLTTTRKEEIRRLNRVAGRLCFRGTYEDEKSLEEGLFLSRIRWEGDQPILEKP